MCALQQTWAETVKAMKRGANKVSKNDLYCNIVINSRQHALISTCFNDT